MGRVAENRVPLKFYIDKELKEDFKKYSNSDSDMSKVLNNLVENYVKKAKRQEKRNK